MSGIEIATGQCVPKEIPTLKKMVFDTYIKTIQVKARIFRKGDESGFLDPQKTIPFKENSNGVKYIGEFNSDYIVMFKDGMRIVPKWEFEKEFKEKT